MADSVGISLNLSRNESNGQEACFHLELNLKHAWARANLGKITHVNLGKRIPISYPSTDPEVQYCNGSALTWPSLPVKVSDGFELSDFVRYDDSSWIVSANIMTTKIPSFHVAYGLAVPEPGRSQVQISLVFMVVVICCNVFKLAAMSWTLQRPLRSQILTLGDCISSFLEKPDSATAGACTLDRRTVLTGRPIREIYKPRKISLLDIVRSQHTCSWAIM